MPMLARPDGVELHWAERGDGPLVVGAFACLSFPAVFDELLDMLAADHRVVSYDARGAGRSTRRGPYDPATDADDLEALLDELGGEATLLVTGEATYRAVRVGARRPELVRAVVSPAGSPLGRSALGESEGLAASSSVIAALLEMMRTDYRAALRTLTASVNQQLDDDAVRRRVDAMVEYADHDVTLERLQHWIDDDATDAALALGDRLWLFQEPDNPWFPPDVVDITRERLPEAHVELVEGGALSRPDITAGVVRQVTAGVPADG